MKSHATAADLLMLQFLTWVDERSRTRADVMDAWRSSCPRLTTWEDAVIEGLVRLEIDGQQVHLTEKGARTLRAAEGHHEPRRA